MIDFHEALRIGPQTAERHRRLPARSCRHAHQKSAVDGTNLEAQRFEVLEKKTEVSNRRVRPQQPKTDDLQDVIDGLEHG